MSTQIAFCGLDCNACEAFIATQAGDVDAMQKIAEKWRQQYNAPEIDAAFVLCDGCSNIEGRHGGYCNHCPVRACCLSKGIENCGHCDRLETCPDIAGFFKESPDIKARLTQIRQSLSG